MALAVIAATAPVTHLPFDSLLLALRLPSHFQPSIKKAA